MYRLLGLALLILYSLVPAARAGVVPTPPLALQDEGTALPISFIVDCQGTGIFCDFNVVTGRLQVHVDGAASGTASTANGLAADPADCLTGGTVPTGINASGTATGCFDVTTPAELATVTATLQPLDPELTALANLVCINGIAEYVAGVLTCGTDDGGVSSFNGRTGAVVPGATDYTATLVGSAPTGSVAATTTQGAITELATEKADAATLATPGTINTGGNPVDWTQLKNVPTGFADGSDDGTGGGGAVASVFGRTGAVVAGAGDYSGGQISTTPQGNLSTGTAQANLTELDTEKADAATLATPGTINTPTNPVDWTQLKNVPPGFQDGTDDGTGGGGAVSSVFGRTGDVVAIVGDYSGGHITTTPGGNLSTGTAQANLIELDTEKAALADLVTDDGTVNQAGDLVSWNKLRDVPADFADGSDASSVGGGADGLQANADVQRQITNAVDLTSAVCIGGTDHKWCWHGNSTEGAVETIFPAQDMNRILAAGFDHNIKASDLTNIATFDETTKTLIVPNQIVSPGIVRQFSAAAPPTGSADETQGFAVHSEWINTATTPSEIWKCTDATTGDAQWVQITSFTQTEKSMQDAANVGRTITNVNSELTAVIFGDGVGGKKMWNDPSLGWQEKVFPDGHQIYNLANTFDLILQHNGVEFVRWDGPTGQQQFLNQGKPTIAIPWTAGSVETDGVNCATQAQANLSGFRLQDFGCVAFATAAGQFTFHIPMRAGWDATDAATNGLPFTLRVRTLGTTSLVWQADVAMWCFGENEALPTDALFNGATPQEISIVTGTTAGLRIGDTTTAITPGGTCADNDTLAVRVRTKSGHTATAAAARVFEGLVHAKYDKLGD